ncbi:MAG: hypothetical protein HQ518_15100 [Rhodopirellula sp.]|nr:hypothetical protein [Rhodopirellula sp.]
MMYSVDSIEILVSLFVIVLLGLALAFGFTKSRNPGRWAAVGVALMFAVSASLFFASGQIMFLGLTGVPLFGWLIYLLVRSSNDRRTGVITGISLAIAIGCTLFALSLRTDRAQRAEATLSINQKILQSQAAMIRQLRKEEDLQRRDLFETRRSESGLKDPGTTESETPTTQIDSLKSSPGVAWYPEVDERFDADVQPSMKATGRTLGQKLISLIKLVTPEKQDPPIIQIHATRTLQHEDFRQALNELATIMRSRFPEAQVLVEQVSPTTSITQLDSNAISIRLTMSAVQMLTPAPWNRSTSELLADVTAELTGSRKKVSVSVRMVDKPWVHEFDVFLASNRGSDLLLDGRSGRLATSALEARNAAVEDAINMLTPVAMQLLRAQSQPLLRTPSETEIADRLKMEMLDGQLIIDRFSQQLTHPMGNLWREAILVRADYSAMQRVLGDFLQQRQREERDRLSLGAALALLAVGIVVLHAFLNWLTKGYHRKKVGLLSGMVAIAGMLVVLILVLSLKFSALV